MSNSIVYSIGKGQDNSQAMVTTSATPIAPSDVTIIVSPNITNHDQLMIALEQLDIFIMQDQTLAQ